MMRILVSIFLFIGSVVTIAACTTDDPMFYKIIKTSGYELRWYYYSRITSDSPDYVDIKEEIEPKLFASL